MSVGRRTAIRALVTAGVSAAALAFTAAPSVAYFGYVPTASFGSAGKGAGQFTNPIGVAIDEGTEDVYVVDEGDNRVEKFNSTGTFLSEINGSETPAKAFSGPTYIAVDNSTDAAKGHVYVADPAQSVIDAFDSSGKYLFQVPVNSLRAITTDVEGHLWDTNGQSSVENSSFEEYNDKGERLLGHDVEHSVGAGIAVDSDGNVYLAHGNGHTAMYSPPTYSEVYEGITDAYTFALNPATNNLFQDNVGSITKWPPFHPWEGGPYELTEETFSGGLSESLGLAIDGETEALYASDAGRSDVEVFKQRLTPDATTGGVSKLTRSTATIEGVVNPDKTKAKYFFEWGEGGSLEHTTTVEEAGEGESPITETVKLSGLTTSTTYSYRLVTENENGKNYHGGVQSFETFGAIENIKTLPSTGVSTTGATLMGELTPNGYETTCWFEYEGGKTPATKTSEQNAGSESKVISLEQAISLEPNTGYQDRLVCKNTLGTSYGTYSSMQTPAAPPTVIGESTSNVARQRAVLHATVNPNNNSTSYYFEYGLTTEYGYKTSEQEVPSAQFSEQPAQGVAVELKSNTLYHFRVVAKNQAGIMRGPDATFTSGTPTPPVVTTLGVSGLSQIGVTLEGLVTTQGLVTSYGFEISSNPECKTNPSVFGPPTGLGSVGAGFAEAPATLIVTDLKPGTEYCYKLVGTNPDGTSEGEVKEFTTLTYPPDQIAVEELRVLTEPFTAWPGINASELLYRTTEATAPAKTKQCKKGKVRKHGKCVKKKKVKKGKSKKKK